jgi:hypothetical protein
VKDDAFENEAEEKVADGAALFAAAIVPAHRFCAVGDLLAYGQPPVPPRRRATFRRPTRGSAFPIRV